MFSSRCIAITGTRKYSGFVHITRRCFHGDAGKLVIYKPWEPTSNRSGVGILLQVQQARYDYSNTVKFVTRNVPPFQTTNVTMEDDMYPMSKTEAYSFVENVLNISHCQESLENNKLSLLNTLIRRMKYTLPFTSIPLVADTRHDGSYILPSMEICKNALLSGQGEGCYNINPFFKAILDHMGFKTYIMLAGIRRLSPLYDFHVATVVQDLCYTGSQHLIDVGNIHPMFQAFPLDFGMESPEYHHKKSVGKFFNSGGHIRYCLLKEKSTKLTPVEDIIQSDGKIWKVQCEYRVRQPHRLSYAMQIFREILVNPQLMIPSSKLVVVGYPNGQRVLINADRCVVEDSEGDYHESKITSLGDFIEAVQKHFPYYAPETEQLERAFSNYAKLRQITYE